MSSIFTFKRDASNKISKQKIIQELKSVVERMGFTLPSKRDFNNLSSISSATVIRCFGSWSNALLHISKLLESEDTILQKKKRAKWTNEILFKEMKRVWEALGQRPSKQQWIKQNPKYSYSTYIRRFDGWKNACLQFLEYIKNTDINWENTDDKIFIKTKIVKDKRDVPLKLRLKILTRDNFKCCLCGRSPATHTVTLHVDHIIPHSLGGKTSEENLRTLCEECNLGKGNS